MSRATPQLEDGYTRIANELLDALVAARLSSRQWAVVMAVVRKTYGFNKKVDDIGLSQLSAMTGIAKPHVSVAVRQLEAMRIFTRTAGQFGHVLGLNKNHKAWVGVTETVTVTESVTGYQIGTKGVTKSVTPPVTESVTTKDNLPKDNQKTLAPSEKISLDADGNWQHIPEALKAKWETAYPALSLDAELAKASAWILANPKNKKSNYARFLTNWLSRAQDSAPKTSTKGTGRHGNFAAQDYRSGVGSDGSF